MKLLARLTWLRCEIDGAVPFVVAELILTLLNGFFSSKLDAVYEDMIRFTKLDLLSNKRTMITHILSATAMSIEALMDIPVLINN